MGGWSAVSKERLGDWDGRPGCLRSSVLARDVPQGQAESGVIVLASIWALAGPRVPSGEVPR